MAGVGLNWRKSAEGNGGSGPLSDCLVQIRKLCGFLHLSLFLHSFCFSLCSWVLWRKKENEKHTEQIIANIKRQPDSETEG